MLVGNLQTSSHTSRQCKTAGRRRHTLFLQSGPCWSAGTDTSLKASLHGQSTPLLKARLHVRFLMRFRVPNAPYPTLHECFFREASRGLERKLWHIIWRHPSFQFLLTWRYFVAALRDWKPVRGRLGQVSYAKSHRNRMCKRAFSLVFPFVSGKSNSWLRPPPPPPPSKAFFLAPVLLPNKSCLKRMGTPAPLPPAQPL